jgi:hypothetical protein
MKSKVWVIAFTFIAALAISLSGQAFAQASQGSMDSEIESLRADMRADKVSIIKDAMKFNDKDAAAFWPVYKKYDAELSSLNDKRVQLIKDYAQKFGSVTDADAKSMADQAFDFEAKRVDLKKKYYKEFNKVLPALTVTKYFQLEHRLDLLVDLNLASELPSLLVQSPVSK